MSPSSSSESEMGTTLQDTTSILADNPKTRDILDIEENNSGVRYCRQCKQLLPLNKFRPGKRRYVCAMHLGQKSTKRLCGTAELRAGHAICCRTRRDMPLFGQPKRIVVNNKQVAALLTAEQVTNFGKWRMVPLDPSKQITLNNIAILGSSQYKFIIGSWKIKKDVNAYRADLQYLVDHDQCMIPEAY